MGSLFVSYIIISWEGGNSFPDGMKDIDHVSYVHQAFEAASFSYFLEILQSNVLNDFDGPVYGYRSVLRTFISAFIASYEINLQLDDAILELILDILCKVYQGEELLCNQFWDRKSFVDGPIRCLLFDLESEFPFRSAEFIRLLSSLSEGSWPAECVYNFLDKSVGVSTLFDITSDSPEDDASQLVETSQPLHISGLEGLVIPSNTRGRILRIISENTCLVRWEYSLSGIIVLIIRLANGLYIGNNREAFVNLELLSRMVTFNKAVCFSLLNVSHFFYAHKSYVNGKMESDVRVVDIICNSVRSLTFDSGGAAVMAMAIDILANLLRCSPSKVAPMVLKANIFDMTSGSDVPDSGNNISLSGTWSLSGKLAKMILIDCEKNDTSCPLVISVLEFTMQLVEGGLENDVAIGLVVFSLQHILASHEYWKYNHGNMRWKVTLKVIEVLKTCLRFSKFSTKLRDVLLDILLHDASVHSALFRIICTTTQTLENLCSSRFVEPAEIEGWQLAIVSVLDVLNITLSQFSESTQSGLPVFHQAMLSSTTKPISVVAAITSLISYFRNPKIQVSGAKVLSKLFTLAESSQLYMISSAGFGLDSKQITDLRNSVTQIVLDLSGQNEDLVIATLKLLTVAARYQPALLVAIFDSNEDSDAGNLKQSGKDASSIPDWACKSLLLHTILQYVERASDFVDRYTDILLGLLDFLKTLWQEAGQYANMLEPFKASKKLWQQFSKIISQVSKLKDSTIGSLGKEDISKLFVKYQCQSSVLEIMACNMFLYKKLLFAESLKKPCVEPKKNNAVSPPKITWTADSDPKDIFSEWCDVSVLDGLIQSVSALDAESEINFQAKVAAVLLIVHLIVKLETSGAGPLSMVLVGKIKLISEMLCAQPAFSELLAQYSKLGYSGGKELMPMIFSDLYCHLQGKLEGRDIPTGPFKELFQFLVESSVWEKYKQKTNEDVNMALGDCLFDTQQIKAELGIDLWDFSDWKTSKTTAEEMLSYMQRENLMVLLSTSQLSVLHALISVMILYEDNSLEETAAVERKIPSQVTLSSIDGLCRKFCSTVDSLASLWDAPKIVFDILTAQADLLSRLLKSAKKSLSLSICALVLKNVGPGLKILGSLRHSNAVLKKTINLLLEVLLLVVGFGSHNSNSSGAGHMVPAKDFAEISDATIGLLPLLCNFMGNPEYLALCLTTVDLILRNFLTPETWFPIIQSQLRLQHVILQLQDKKSTVSVSAILKFFLTIAQVNGGAQMLLNSGFFSTLRALFVDVPDGMSLVSDNEKGSLREKTEKPQHIWGIGLAVVTAMVHSLVSVSTGADIVESVISYFFLEKGFMISYYLAAPDFPSDDRDKVRPRSQRTWTSLAYLRETEHTLLLMCALASHWRSWVKIMKGMDSPLREMTIHLLAFISKGAQRLRESQGQTSHLLCPPIVKEEFDSCKRPSIINSKHGWFALAPLVCVGKPKITAISISTALVIRGHTAEDPGSVTQSQFTDSVAVQIYRVAFVLLKFLCLQAEGVVKRAEEVGYVDLAHFPELPEPEILHGLQDQATAIVAELCDNYKSKAVPDEVKKLCLLLIQTTEMSLYLELCVVQVCRIHPVFGRVDNFSKELKKLVKAAEVHTYLEPSMDSLKKIAVFLYPGSL
ncbi:uncharacterized protein LOC17879317 isoform X2 [Capsella rubella]|uniref:uncharacterized protein LOC17879317 isoform X2 n=1 Tax=Capsella rubella TaxID=81985 RepID=UPI000CD56047|nr:uncharacterized protein LOC17879317 isoform X2 [Capsella rubella]